MAQLRKIAGGGGMLGLLEHLPGMGRAMKDAKAAGAHKASREEMCKLVTTMFEAESKWMHYAKKNATSCGMPPQLLTQMQTGHTHIATMRKNICDGGGAAGAAAPPTLSDALGTANLPQTAPTTSKRGGAFDTLTGSVVR